MGLFSTLYNYKHVIIFYSLIVLLVYIFRKKFEIHGKIVALYKTQFGIKFIDYIANKYREWVKLFGYCSVGIGFVGLVAMFVLMLKFAIDLIFGRISAGASPVIPGVPIAGTGLVFPLIIGWLTIFIIVVVHEFSHGIVAKAFNLDILNTGFAFFGPILGAFVQPDEKKLQKRPDIEQYSVFAAGPISNVVLTVIVLLLMSFVLSPIVNAVTDESGIKLGLIEEYPAEAAGLPDDAILIGYNDIEIKNTEDLIEATKGLKPDDEVTLITTERSYTFAVDENPDDSSRGYMGIIFKQNEVVAKQGYGILYVVLKWFQELFFWVWFLSINIGLINLFPIFITDGARMLKVFVERVVPDKKKAFKIWKNINILCVMILLSLVFLPLFKYLIGLA